ncbi:unnamed protein product [Prunus armeniaca]
MKDSIWSALAVEFMAIIGTNVHLNLEFMRIPKSLWKESLHLIRNLLGLTLILGFLLALRMLM